MDFAAASREPSVIARRSGVEESSTATTSKISLANFAVCSVDKSLRMPSSTRRAAAFDSRLTPPKTGRPVEVD
ncbi:MAG: hypothetical protein RL288_158 [Actinomycetota bacterium]